jgi:hypothetical protein
MLQLLNNSSKAARAKEKRKSRKSKVRAAEAQIKKTVLLQVLELQRRQQIRVIISNRESEVVTMRT